MDLETIVKRIDNMENQLSSIKKVITGQNSRINQIDERAMGFLEKAREQNSELSRINSALTGFSQFDTEITKLRVDINRQIEEAEKRIQLNEKMQEKIRAEEFKSFNATIEKFKDFSQDFDQKLKLLTEEYSGQALKIKEINNNIDTKINSDEELKVRLNQLLQENRPNKKVLDNLTAEVDIFKKRNDELSSRLDIIARDMRTFDSRLNEIVATETERKQSFISFIEKQSLTGNERERIWSDWTTQFEESINQVYKLLPELQSQKNEMKKTQALFDEISQKFDRRANEITEMYRLMDDKFRKEWATFKTDLEKRWSNVSLIMEDKQGGSDNKLQKINERIVEVEDETQEMQEALILMSREIQKGMQSLMNMVNGWMDAFGQIKSQR